MNSTAAGPGFEVVARQDFSDVTFLLEIRHPMLAKAARPGQFVIVMSHEQGERIPLTIADFDRDKGTITLVIQAVGKTTREMQRDCQRRHAALGARGADGDPQSHRQRRARSCAWAAASASRRCTRRHARTRKAAPT